ncbi:hypothetical protein J2I47_16440 [Fibrella sp. HMF5335]|uniref:Uncharacterized protein n=1 Tax=Fibrella rubiginis TaxID=2817060 RepID=A0A939GFE8_9BACT|nr:hypothetical protein [Fibrella rubiginis]MBO0938142.1 hypothetical protein [Fibrella rubiginis]
MFGLFKRKKPTESAAVSSPLYQLPAHLISLITPAEYNQILQLTIEQLSLKGTIEAIHDDGSLSILFAGQQGATLFFLDNLLRKCKAADQSEWEAIVFNHVKILPINSAAITYIYKDFEFAAPLLKVQVKPKGFAKEVMQDCVYRQDFPDTYTFLVIDFQDALHYVRSNEAEEWEKPVDQLFDVALANIAREKTDVSAYLLAERLPFFTLFHNDFAAAYAIELDQNIEEAIGAFGAVVSIPAKGVAFVHPIETDTVFDYIGASHELVQSFYTDEIYTVTDRYYWYYQGQYQLFPYRVEGNKAYLSYPAKLRNLLEE